jgi:uncharacterized protein (TIGR00251 family)
MKLPVRVIPNARKTEFSGRREGEFVLRLNAPALEGRANKAAIEFIAAHLGVPRSYVTLLTGEKSRHKIFEIVGLDPSDVEGRLA